MARPAKTTEETKKKIRKMYSTGKYAYHEIARQLGTTIMVVRYWATDRIHKQTQEKNRQWQKENRDKFLQSMREYQKKRTLSLKNAK